RELHHGRARCGRRDAQLSEHLVPRRLVCPPGAEPEARARIRGVAREDARHGYTRCAASARRRRAGTTAARLDRRMTDDPTRNVEANPWDALRRFTNARIALG